MYNLRHSANFKKGFKKIKRNPCFVLSEFKQIINDLINGKFLDEKYQNHKLHGEWKGYYECHLAPDILLIYEINNEESIIYMYRIGSHSELF